MHEFEGVNDVSYKRGYVTRIPLLHLTFDL
jgi:hypothetical protein